MNNQQIPSFLRRWPEGVSRMEVFEPNHKIHKRNVGYKVVVTGRAKEIDAVMAYAVSSNSSIYPDPESAPLCIDECLAGEADPRLAGFAGIEIRQYALKKDNKKDNNNEEAVWDAVRTIYNCAASIKGGPMLVFADPNLVTGNPVSGGSGGVNGGPFGLARGVPEYNGKGLTPAEVFRRHWAFGPQQTNPYFGRWGINLEKTPGQRLVPETGAGTRVFILDTYDPSLCASQPGEMSLLNPSQVTVERDYLDRPLNLSISCIPGVGKNVKPDDPQCRHEHGLFVAGLLHRVAPDANLHLVQLLNDYGQGEVYTLAKVLAMVAAYAMHNKAEAALPLSDVVVNMSLEANFSEEMVLSLGVRDAIQTLWEKAEGKFSEQDALYHLLKEMTKGFYYLPSVRVPIQILSQMGAVIVSAAGNESADYYGHLPMAIPARYAEVIGVSATNYKGQLSSFSNIGDVCAPGGGVEDPEDPVHEVEEVIKLGLDPSLYTMVSTVPVDQDKDGLAYWWGTSFATPLVSGLAALIQEKFRKVNHRGATPAEVADMIKNSARNGVINITEALY